ncbi:hypothetical protein [Alkalitalea saponilacus]|uniref:Lipoprotein n=1 Tax=Alkalitalea saponilacus TaxID=889453 RepID=A0A1T5E8L5_9BACT|nr:hypothetical protein [Alkalitalea saponilacus]ASB49079.1 hypothetical protein CDL62_07975 [Alkalitalea saponilacus]SKB80221.1 hypothetical protein SAMN03080601_01236 [Alkalitalea saponilacus]
MVKILIIIPLIILGLLSCHSKHITLDYSTHHGACWNSDSTKIAVIISSTAFRRPEGISRFPDGGRVKYEFKKTALYIYSLHENNLREIDDFSDLVSLIGTNRSSWDGKIDFRDSILYYKIDPVLDWDFLKRLAAKQEDKLGQIPILKEKYDKIFQYELTSGETNSIDTTELFGLFSDISRVNLTQLNQKLNNVPLSQMGLVLSSFHNKPEEQLIDETIFLQNKSATTRKAVFEQIISELDERELQSILNRMERYKSRSTGLEKDRYEKNSKELYENIKALL